MAGAEANPPVIPPGNQSNAVGVAESGTAELFAAAGGAAGVAAAGVATAGVATAGVGAEGITAPISRGESRADPISASPSEELGVGAACPASSSFRRRISRREGNRRGTEAAGSSKSELTGISRGGAAESSSATGIGGCGAGGSTKGTATGDAATGASSAGSASG